MTIDQCPSFILFSFWPKIGPNIKEHLTSQFLIFNDQIFRVYSMYVLTSIFWIFNGTAFHKPCKIIAIQRTIQIAASYFLLFRACGNLRYLYHIYHHNMYNILKSISNIKFFMEFRILGKFMSNCEHSNHITCLINGHARLFKSIVLIYNTLSPKGKQLK